MSIQSRTTVAFVPRETFSQTERTLEKLYEQTAGNFELICVDGGSPPSVQKYLEEASREKGFLLIRTDAYISPNQARNLALDHVTSEYVVFVDNDCLVTPG
jgi:glycosyltransferase involved in cell wall biosynthesis